MKAEILTAWIGDGLTTDTAFRPQVADDYAVRCEDITGQPAANITPTPNLYSVQVECDQATLDAIESDNTYHIMWSET